MRLQPTLPTGQQQQFEVNETFFSTTDHRGVITAGNQVFSRTSGYTLQELVGQPHNLIRHRDMPRCVFRLLWQAVKDGKSFAGYVKNQAKNGNHYWVFALIVPIPSGLLSVRIKPTTNLISKVEDLYKSLLAIEVSALESNNSESEASSASAEALANAITGLGFPSYEAFSHHALNAEIKARDAEVASRGLRLFPTTLDSSSPLSGTFRDACDAYERINVLFASLDSFTEIAAKIQSHNTSVRGIAENFRIDALNVHIASHPLGNEGIAIGMVAQFLSGYAQNLAGNVSGLTDNIRSTSTSVAAITSNLSTARIQIEMLLSFLAEVAGADKSTEMQQLTSMANDLRSAFLATIQTSLKAIDDLQQSVPAVKATNERVSRDIIQLQVAQITGLTEVARLRDAENLNAMFSNLRTQIESAKGELHNLEDIVDQLITLTASTPPKVNAIQSSLSGLRQIEATAAVESRIPGVDAAPDLPLTDA